VTGVSQRERSRSKAEKRARTPKASKSRHQVQPIDEKTEQDLEKELKARREAAEKIK
jgi:tubulin monoglycylase TTLL3/8